MAFSIWLLGTIKKKIFTKTFSLLVAFIQILLFIAIKRHLLFEKEKRKGDENGQQRKTKEDTNCFVLTI